MRPKNSDDGALVSNYSLPANPNYGFGKFPEVELIFLCGSIQSFGTSVLFGISKFSMHLVPVKRREGSTMAPMGIHRPPEIYMPYGQPISDEESFSHSIITAHVL